MLMFQVILYFCALLLCLFLSVSCSSLKEFCHLLQGLTIIAFKNGHINLDTFKMVLSVGPSFAIMNFIESKLFASSMYFVIISHQ